MTKYLGDGRLRNIERARGGADRAVQINGVENFNLAQVHRRGPFGCGPVRLDQRLVGA
jgi:hypothetical protein